MRQFKPNRQHNFRFYLILGIAIAAIFAFFFLFSVLFFAGLALSGVIGLVVWLRQRFFGKPSSAAGQIKQEHFIQLDGFARSSSQQRQGRIIDVEPED